MLVDFKEIELSDRPVIEHYLSMRYYDNSEFCFSNLFIWRYGFNLKFSVIDDYLCIVGRLERVFISYSLPSEEMMAIWIGRLLR